MTTIQPHLTRTPALRRVAVSLVVLVGTFLVARAVMEFFVIDWHDPASYAPDWGGPSLAGVLAVHCGPGLVVLGLAVFWFVRRTPRRDLDAA